MSGELMEGLNYLSKTEIYTGAPLAVAIMSFLFAAVLIAFAIICKIKKWDNKGDYFWYSLFTALLLFLGIATLINKTQEDKYETHYEVTIDDSVGLKEFNSKYEILEINGEIYTITERKDK